MFFFINYLNFIRFQYLIFIYIYIVYKHSINKRYNNYNKSQTSLAKYINCIKYTVSYPEIYENFFKAHLYRYNEIKINTSALFLLCFERPENIFQLQRFAEHFHLPDRLLPRQFFNAVYLG